MSLILGLGSNLGDKRAHLVQAKEELCQVFKLRAESRIYSSPAVLYLNQPDFYNQVLEFELPSLSAEEILQITLGIEKRMGRQRDIPKGPRVIDIDLLFLHFTTYQSATLTIPHPAWHERHFVVAPLQELPFYSNLQSSWQKNFSLPSTFDHQAQPVSFIE